jgi:FkbM family methyltransferase
MLIPLQEILNKYKLNPKGVIHVGAHFAEEHEDYIKCGIERFVYIEPCKQAFGIMNDRINEEGALLFNVACGAEEKYEAMYVSHQNQGQSNSFLEPNLHLQQHPEIIFDDAEIVKMVTLDSLPIKKEDYSLLVIDTEGYEGHVLRGATKTLKHIDILYTEINKDQTRIGNLLIEELDAMLPEFKRVETFWPSPNFTWGDCILIRKSVLHE